MSNVMIFPGQGSQKAGMGKDLYDAFQAARHVFHEVDDALSEKLSKIIFEGTDEELTLTHNAQPALMAVSMAIIHTLVDIAGFDVRKLQCVAGHSLGEYSALAGAGALSVANAARLLRTRGLAMQRAVPVGKGAMAAVLGLDVQDVKDVAKAASTEDLVCVIANDNAPGQIVMSGHVEAVEKAMGFAQEKGAKRSIRLPVSAPFHCPLMQPAADEMAEALANTEFVAPAVPLVSNVTARYVTNPQTIKSLLIEQVTGSVRWRESMAHMAESGANLFIEVGSGKVLTGLGKRCAPDAVHISLNTPQDIHSFLETL